MTINIECRICKEIHKIECNVEDYYLWKNGMLIQKAMPNLKPEERELLISQTCNKCWNKLFDDSDKEEE